MSGRPETTGGRRAPAVEGAGVVPAAVTHRRAGAHRLRSRPPLVIVAVLILLTAEALLMSGRAPWQSRTGRAEWHISFDGYGEVRYEQDAVVLAPARPTSDRETHSALVVSAQSYGDFAATVRLRTERQLRRRPNPWEVGWVLWHCTSQHHFYAVVLKTTGWELSKQDPRYPGGQRFLASGKTPTFAVGTWHTVGIVQIGNQIEVAVDGRPLARFVDSANPYLGGRLGLYAEDSQARFTGVELRPVPSSTAKGATAP
jgi:hypothetical protein